MIKIDELVSLAPLTTFKVGGPAKYFTKVSSVEELKEALALAKEKTWPVFILAGGSNLIVSSRGFMGLVVQIDIKSLKIRGSELTAGAANSMEELVDESIDSGLAGLEWAGGLPGSFGGAIRGNAGAFGGEIKDTIISVTSVHHHSGQIKTRTNRECDFIYRGSIFKSSPHEVIIEATLKLSHGDTDELRKIADEHIAYRHEKHPMEFPNSGSIFKNTPVELIPEETLEIFEASIKTDPFPVIPTAKIIGVAGLGGLSVGGAQVSTKHTNYIINTGKATGEDIRDLINLVKEKIFNLYGIELEVEPEMVGF